MNVRRTILEASTLVIAALLCAVVANAFASRERKMALSGSYPNATRVPVATATESMPGTATNMVRFDTQANSVVSNAPTATMPMTQTLTATTPGFSPPAAVSAPATSTAKVPLKAPSPASASIPNTSPSGQAPAVSSVRADSAAKFSPHEKVPYVELQGDDVAELHRHGALFIDARRTSIYQQGHIAGARSFPVWESDVDERVAKLFNERSDPRQQAEPIVVYCSGGDCEDSHMLSQKLWGAQFNNVYVYKDGFPDWEKRGGSVHRGDAP